MTMMVMMMHPVTVKGRSHNSSFLSFASAFRLMSNCSPIVLPEQIVNENFLLCRRQGHSHLLSASTESMSNGCD